MNKRTLALTLPLVMVFAVFASLPLVHAGPGYPGPGGVCLNDPSVVVAANPCTNIGSNPTPFIFNGPFPTTPENSSQQIRVGVYINDSAGLYGFSVVLNTTYSNLKPAGVDMTGSVISAGTRGTPTILAECLSGNLIQGSSCNPADTISTLEMSALSALGDSDTASPTTGLLFTAIFNITGTALPGGVAIDFATSAGHCGATSVSGNVCVTISSVALGTVPETVQASTFDNSLCPPTCGWYALTSNVTTTKVLQSSTGTGTHVGINATSESCCLLGGGAISYTAVATPILTPTFYTPNPILTPTQCTPGPTTPCRITVTIDTSTAGTYYVTLYGRYRGDDCGPGGGCTTTYSLIATLTFQVNIEGVSWTVNSQLASAGQTMYFAKGTFSLPYAFQSLGFYTGTITLSQSTCTPGTTGVSCPVALPPAFTLPSNKTVTRLINFTATGYGKLLYKDTMGATSPSLPSQTQGQLTIDISGYSMVANTTSLTITTSNTGHIGVTLKSLGVIGSFFTGTVTLGSTASPSTGLIVVCPSFPPPSLTAGGTTTATCTVDSIVPNTYSLTFTGAGGTNNAMTNSTAVISVTVNPTLCQSPTQCYDIRASPASATVLVSTNATTTIILNSTSLFSGTVHLSETSSPSGLVCSFKPVNVTLGTSGTSKLSCKSSSANAYAVTVYGVSGPIYNATTLTFTFQDYSIASNPATLTTNVGAAGSSAITVSPQNGFSGTVILVATTNSTNLSCTLSSGSIPSGSGSSTLSCTPSAPGHYLATVKGNSTGLVHSTTVTYTVPVPDFSISANPTTVTPFVGVAGTSTVTVSSLNGFTGTVTLAVTTNSTSLSCTLSSTSITGGSGTSTLSCTGSASGNYQATVTGTSSSLSHSATVTYRVPVPDFTVSASPTSLTVNSGASGTSTITITSVNGFSGTVTLTVTTNSTNLVCTLSVSSVSGSGSSTLSCTSSSAGNYLATVKGTSSSLSHTATTTYNEQDFTVAASPTSVPVDTGSSGTSTVTIASVNGFGGTVTLAVTTNSTNLSCTLSSMSVSGSGTSTLSCSSGTAGNYLATVTSTSGGLSHTASVTYTVTTSSTTIFGLSPLVFYSIIGVVIAAIAAGVAVLLLRRRGAAPPATPTTAQAKGPVKKP